MIILASLSSLLSVKTRQRARQTSCVRMRRQRQDAFKRFCLRGSWDPLPHRKSRMQIPRTWGWVICKSMITVLYFNIFGLMLGVFNMLRHQRHRLEEDCLTAVLLIKSVKVSPLSWRFLFSPRRVTETAGDRTSAVLLNSPRLGCDLSASFSICTNLKFLRRAERRGRASPSTRLPLNYKTRDQSDVLWLLSTDCQNVNRHHTALAKHEVIAHRCLSTLRNGETTGAWARGSKHMCTWYVCNKRQNAL